MHRDKRLDIPYPEAKDKQDLNDYKGSEKEDKQKTVTVTLRDLVVKFAL